MKKLTSLICALVIVMSADAAPQFGTKRSEQVRPADKTQLTRHKKARPSTHFLRPEDVTAAQTMRMNAPRAKEEAEQVVASQCSATYYPEDKAIWYGLTTEDWSKSFYFSLLVEEGKRDVEPGKTYTLADMEPSEEGSYPNRWDDEDWNEHPYKEATFTKTIGTGYDIHIVATVTDTSGNSFEISYDEEPLVLTGDSVDIVINSDRPDVEYISDGTWLLRAGGEDFGYSLQLNYYSDDKSTYAGSYPSEEIAYNATTIAVFTDEIDEYGDKVVKFLTAKDGIINVEDSESAITATGLLVANDGNVYRFHVVMNKPVAEKQVTISSANLTINADWYEYTQEVGFLAADDVNEVDITLCPAGLGELMAGEYTIGFGGTRATVRTVDPMDDVETTAFSGKITVEYSAGSIRLTGSILGYDNTEYILDLSYIKPEKTSEKELAFENLTLAVFSDNSWQILGYNNKRNAYISLAAEPVDFFSPSGNYTHKNIVPDYSYIVTDISANGYKQYTILEADFTMDYSAADSTAMISGKFLCVNMADATDVPEFTITAKGVIPNPYEYDEAKADYQHHFATFTTDLDYAADGEIYVDATENGNMVGLRFYVEAGATALPAGTYAINNSREQNTVFASPGLTPNGQLQYSFAALVNEAQQSITNAWFLASGTVTVTESGVIEVQAQNTKGKAVSVRLGEYPEAIENTDATVKAAKTIRNGQLLIIKNGVEYNAQGTVIK